MISRLAAVLSAGLWMTAPASGAVIYTDLPEIPVFQGGLFPATERIDLNSDGEWDIEFYAHDDIFKVITRGSLHVSSIPAAPPNQGADILPYDSGDFIGSLLPSGVSWNSGEAFFYGCALFGESLVCIGLWGNGIDHLGFRIEEDDGFHYGYITVDTPFLGIHGGFIQGFGYESSPDTAIQAGAVPEPSATLLVLAGMTIGLCKRRRQNNQCIIG